jgi:hypothetical protein
VRACIALVHSIWPTVVSESTPESECGRGSAPSGMLSTISASAESRAPCGNVMKGTATAAGTIAIEILMSNEGTATSA